jgi:hypothetical protein
MILLALRGYMKTILTVMSLLALCGTPVLAQRATASRVTAWSVLKLREPEVVWIPRSLLKADFDYDGVADYALGGRKGGLYVLGAVKGSISSKSKHWTLEFSQDAGDQGGLCSVAGARIRVERLSADEVEGARELPRTSRGINLYDDECDSFHIYYDRMAERFVWWRL